MKTAGASQGVPMTLAGALSQGRPFVCDSVLDMGDTVGGQLNDSVDVGITGDWEGRRAVYGAASG